MTSPQNGTFIKTAIELTAELKSSRTIKTIEIYFNNTLLDRVLNIEKYFIYQKTLTPKTIELQNILKILVIDELDNKTEKEILLYR